MTEWAWFVGIDVGSTTHAWCLLDQTGHRVGTRTVAHTDEAVRDAIQWVRTHTQADSATIAVALESPRGVVVDTLLEERFAVFAINPKQLDRFRDRFTAAGAKDDRRDAHVAADSLRTDPRAFRRVQPDDPRVIQLRELTRLVEDCQRDERRLCNRLREQLVRVHAAWLDLSPAADDPWLWRLLQQTPHPTAWPTLTRRRIHATLQRQRIRKITADAVVTALQSRRLSVAAGVPDAVATRIAALIPHLELLRTQRRSAEHQLDRVLADLATGSDGEREPREHRDVVILRSLPGVGRTVCATMLAEASHPLAARDYSTLRTYGGTAPVTMRSGTRVFHVQMRYACKPRLRQALYHWGRTSLQHDPAAQAYYEALRARGHSHGRALRSVADRWLRILTAMLITRTLYDPSRFVRAAA